MNQSLAYFQGIDLSGELEELLADLKTKGKYTVDELFDTFANIDASIIQELLILEVSFRMIYADGRVDENEIKFLRFLRSHLKLHDETIRDRFGVVEYLFDKDYSQEIIKKEVCNDLFESFIIPKAKEIQAIDFGQQ